MSAPLAAQTPIDSNGGNPLFSGGSRGGEGGGNDSDALSPSAAAPGSYSSLVSSVVDTEAVDVGEGSGGKAAAQ
jgi:hypothetical protein